MLLIKKQRKKERKKSPENNTSSPTGGGVKTGKTKKHEKGGPKVSTTTYSKVDTRCKEMQIGHVTMLTSNWCYFSLVFYAAPQCSATDYLFTYLFRDA